MASCTYSVPDKNASGDNFYGAYICQQQYIDYFWAVYGFNGNKRYWDDGFGWHDCCNTDKPLGRTFNACYLLTYSASDYQNDSYDAPQNILQWGRRYVRDSFNNLRSFCGDGGAVASFSGGNAKLFLSFWYDYSVVERAAIILHEARHEAKGHNATFPAGSVFGTSNDADSTWIIKEPGPLRQATYGVFMLPAREQHPPLEIGQDKRQTLLLITHLQHIPDLMCNTFV